MNSSPPRTPPDTLRSFIDVTARHAGQAEADELAYSAWLLGDPASLLALGMGLADRLVDDEGRWTSAQAEAYLDELAAAVGASRRELGIAVLVAAAESGAYHDGVACDVEEIDFDVE